MTVTVTLMPKYKFKIFFKPQSRLNMTEGLISLVSETGSSILQNPVHKFSSHLMDAVLFLYVAAGCFGIILVPGLV